MPVYLLALNYWLHLLASVIWIGGLALNALVIRPALARVLSEKRSAQVQDELQRRFTPFANLSLVVLVVTGILQMVSDSNYDGLLNFNNVWTQAILLKHLAVGAMVIIALYVQLGLNPALERARLLASRRIKEANLPVLRIREQRISLLNLGFGLLVLLFTALATAQ